MTKTLKVSLALVLGLSAGSVLAQNRTPAQLDSYVYAPNGQIWRSGFNLCWRTVRWTPAGAVRECDPDLFKDEAKVGPVGVPDYVPQEIPAVASQKITYQADAFFDFDKYALKPAGKKSLDELAQQIKLVDLELIIATGYTDWIGTEAYNYKLSLRRANAVKAYLVSKGVPADQIKVVGKGKNDPIASNKTAAGRAKNRRVEIVVYATERQ